MPEKLWIKPLLTFGRAEVEKSAYMWTQISTVALLITNIIYLFGQTYEGSYRCHHIYKRCTYVCVSFAHSFQVRSFTHSELCYVCLICSYWIWKIKFITTEPVHSVLLKITHKHTHTHTHTHILLSSSNYLKGQLKIKICSAYLKQLI